MIYKIETFSVDLSQARWKSVTYDVRVLFIFAEAKRLRWINHVNVHDAKQFFCWIFFFFLILFCYKNEWWHVSRHTQTNWKLNRFRFLVRGNGDVHKMTLCRCRWINFPYKSANDVFSFYFAEENISVENLINLVTHSRSDAFT